MCKKPKKKERKVYPMKITKILPLVFALALVCPAFAAESPSVKSAASTVNLTLKDYVKVSTSTPTINQAANFNADYTILEIPSTIQPSFGVINNVYNQTLTLTAKTKNNTLDALYKKGTGWAIAFANTGDKNAANIPADSMVTSLTAGAAPTVETNENVIALSIDAEAATWTETLGGSHTTDVSGQNAVVYTLDPGTYGIVYSLGTTQMPDTFSTHDASGTYSAVLTLTATTGA